MGRLEDVHHLFNIGAWDQSRDKETGQVSPFSYNPVCVFLCVCVCECVPVTMGPGSPRWPGGPTTQLQSSSSSVATRFRGH